MASYCTHALTEAVATRVRPAQDQANQNNNIDGRNDLQAWPHAEEILDSFWGSKNNSSLRIWPMVGFPSSVKWLHTHAHVAAFNWTPLIIKNQSTNQLKNNHEC